MEWKYINQSNKNIFNSSRIQAFIALSMVATLLSVSLSMLSIWNNLSIVCLQIFVGFHSGIVGLAIFAYLCRILATDDGQQGIILKKVGLITYNFHLEANQPKDYELIDEIKKSNSHTTPLDDENLFENVHVNNDTS